MIHLRIIIALLEVGLIVVNAEKIIFIKIMKEGLLYKNLIFKIQNNKLKGNKVIQICFHKKIRKKK
jgi:hypothetical protein